MTDDELIDVVRGVFGWNELPIRSKMTHAELAAIPIVKGKNPNIEIRISNRNSVVMPTCMYKMMNLMILPNDASAVEYIRRSICLDATLSVVGLLKGEEYIVRAMFYERDDNARILNHHYRFLTRFLGSFDPDAPFPLLIGGVSSTFRAETVTLKWVIDNVLGLKYADMIGYQSRMRTKLYVDNYDGDLSCVQIPGPRAIRALAMADDAMKHLLTPGRILGNAVSTIYIIYESGEPFQDQRTTQTLSYLGRFLPIPQHLIDLIMGIPTEAAVELVYDNLEEGIGRVYD